MGKKKGSGAEEEIKGGMPMPREEGLVRPGVLLTPSQREAVEAVSGGVLVSAAAGSGKTATLAERVARLICEERGMPGGACGVGEILVVTFTENAAAEMRGRIERVVRGRAEESGSAHARREALLIGRLAVGTIHSFCSRVIREHFQVLGIDPKFGVLPGEEIAVVEAEVIRAVLDGALLGDSAAATRELIEWFGNGDDERIGALVLRTHRLLASVVDREAWKRAAVERVQAGAADPRASTLGLEFVEEVARRVAWMREVCEREMRVNEAAFPAYAGYVREEVLPWVELWEQEMGDGREWELTAGPEKLPNVPSSSDKSPEKEAAQKRIGRLKGEVVAGPYPGGVPTDEGFWRESLTSSLGHVRELLRLVGEFEAAYRAAKDARRVVDFNDLERMALELLSDESNGVARGLRRKYRFVLVDECQDLNAVQDRILSLVSREGGARRGDEAEWCSNLFMVGDVKQSVYRFRLAEPKLFEGRERAYEKAGSGGQVIRLSENFRSRAGVLDVVNAMFERLMVAGRTEVDYLRGHALKAGMEYPAGTFVGSPAELYLVSPRAKGVVGAEEEGGDKEDLEVIEREAEVIARRIREMVGLTGGARAQVFDKGLKAMRAIGYGDMAVLMRVGKVKSKLMATMLRRRGVPVFADVVGGLLEAQEVRDVLALLQLLDNPERDLPLAGYLRSPLSLMARGDEAMARARVAFPAVPFHQAVGLYVAAGGDEYAAGLGDALGRVAMWREMARRRNIAEVIEDVYEKTYFTTFAAGLPDGAQREANLVELLNHARSYVSAAGKGGGRMGDVGGFTAYIKAVEEEADGLSQASVVPPAAGSDTGVVTIQTVHKSKGLEYSVVFLPDLGKGFNTQDLNGGVIIERDSLVSAKAVSEEKRALYPSPAWVVARERLKPRLLAEELRVLYVAMTRAREHLVLVGTAEASVVEEARAMYAGESGVMSESAVLGVKSALEWVVGAGVLAENGGTKVVDVRLVGEEELEAWGAEAGRAAGEGVPEEVMALRPIGGGVVTAEAAAVGERLGWVYPHAGAVGRRAAISVTALTHSMEALPGQVAKEATEEDGRAATGLHGGTRTAGRDGGLGRYVKELAWPKLVAENTAEMVGTDRGTATHLALEHFDFGGDVSSAGITAQLVEMVRREILTVRDMGAVDVGAIRFVVEDAVVGALMRGERGTVYRELPVYIGRGEAEEVKEDWQMVRGRIDVMVDTADGPVVVDWKTDDVWGERLEERVALYAGQVAFYRQAAEAITGRWCAGVYLVFVGARARVVRKM